LRRLGWWGAFAIEGYFFFLEHANREREDRADTKWQWKNDRFLKDGTSNVEFRRARESDEEWWTRHRQRTVNEAFRAYPNSKLKK
jgi:hypothetical protein